ncbi:MAG TPA: aldo/keto reductase [Actinomycetaceae bacterium]|nr:aldo/keto reductase [Actinomycetaceae bacterium]
MQFRRVGRSGLLVSSIGLGTMTWGRDTDEHEAGQQLTAFLDAGGTLIDTAATYGQGLAEEVVGALLRDVHRRDVVLSSKAGVRDLPGGPVVDSSRGTLLDTLDESLTRLGTDYLDLWLVQAPDLATDPAETMSALRYAVSSGRARYVGLSNHPAWLSAYLAAGLREDGTGLAAVQVEHSLLNRGAEREMLPAATGLGFGVLGWSPLGRGVLTGKYRRSVPADSRAASAHLRGFVEPYLTEEAGRIVEALATAADGLERSPAEVALAWARDTPGVASAITGARTAAQLRATLGAADLELPEPIREALADVSAATRNA